MRRSVFVLVLVPIAVVAGAGLWYRDFTATDRTDPVDATAGPVTVLPFATGFALDPLPPGWTHRRFLTAPPMVLSFGRPAGGAGLRCSTDGSGSLLLRATDIPLAGHPILTWRWLVEIGLPGGTDETLAAHDDHPIRLFADFADGPDTDDGHAVEIIWSNGQFGPGEVKRIGGFHHLVANGGAAAEGVWHDQSVDLRALYRDSGGTGADPRLTTLGLFCDSDDGGGRTASWIGDVVLSPP